MFTLSIQNIANNIKILVSSQGTFWFRNPGPASKEEFIFILLTFTIVTFIGISVLLYNRRIVGTYPPKNKILKPGAAGLVGFGIAGAVFSLFRWQGIDFLGARFILLVFFLAAIIWAAFFLYLYRKNVPDQAVKYEAGLLKKKYLSK